MTQNIIASASFSYVSYFFSVSVRLREAYAIGLYLPILPCDNIPPIAYPEASVVRTKGCEKSGRCKSGFSHNPDCKISKPVCSLSVHMKGVSFFRS